MIVSTPYTECYIKKSFLAGKPNYGKDETVFGVLYAIRFIRARAPLYIVYLPSMGALYDKVDQCAIFNRSETPETTLISCAEAPAVATLVLVEASVPNPL